MELSGVLRSTGAVRQFTGRPVDHDTVVDILDTARYSPSGGNRQPWKVAVLQSPETRRSLANMVQPVWNEYVASQANRIVPFNLVDYTPPAEIPHADNVLLDQIEQVPVVLAVAADLSKIVAMDATLDRPAIVPGASIYPFCWSIVLAARNHGLGGVLTTFATAVEPAAGSLLKLPEHHALAATIFLGHPLRKVTRLKRKPVEAFTTIDTFDGAPFAPSGL